MGGIRVDRSHRTSLPGLYAAGECACQYHGANRLGGNSTLAAVYGGRIAAVREYIPADAAKTAAADELAAVRERLSAMTGKTRPTGKLRKLQEIIADAMGIVRTGSGLENGLALLATLWTEPVSALP